MRTGGIVLCGGCSSRMGRPKAWLPFCGELMLPRVARILREVVDPVVVVAAPDQEVPLLPAGVAVVRDEGEGKGPLAGLAAGLAALEAQCDAVFLSSCDVPLLRAAFVRRVVARLEGSSAALAAVPRVGGFFHPLAGAYRIAVLPAVRAMLAAEQFRATGLLALVATCAIEADELTDADAELDSLRNLNTPDEYEAALIRVREGS